MSPIFLTSYPLSANTFLRTVLFQCFNLKSGSVHGNDLDGNIKLENYVGHIEHKEDSSITFPEGQLPIIKTHGENILNAPVIYVLRDGRAATVSLWEYYGRETSISDIIDAAEEKDKELKKETEVVFAYKQLCKVIQQIITSSKEERESLKGLVPFRINTIVVASIIIHYIMEAYSLKDVRLSRYALREGVLGLIFDNM